MTVMILHALIPNDSDHARSGVGYLARSAYIPYGRHHGWACAVRFSRARCNRHAHHIRQVHRHGDDLEPTRRRRCQLLRRTSHHQLDPPNHPLFPLVFVLRQGHLTTRFDSAAIWTDGNCSVNLPRHPTFGRGDHAVCGDGPLWAEVLRACLSEVLWAPSIARSTLHVRKYTSSVEVIAEIGRRVILICAEQASRILDQIGQVFRVFVPMVLYFVVMWTGTFFLVYKLTRRKGGSKLYGYQMAVVQVSGQTGAVRFGTDWETGFYRWFQQVNRNLLDRIA